MSSMVLTVGACKSMIQGLHDNWSGVMQILKISPLKAFTCGSQNNTCIVELSDGIHYIEATLDHNLNTLIRACNVTTLSLIRVERFTRLQHASGAFFYLVARLSGKDTVHAYNTQNGKGRVHNLTFHDSMGKIGAVAFNSATEVTNSLESGQVYSICNATVCIAKAAYNKTLSLFQLTISMNTEFELVQNFDLPIHYLDIVPFAKIADMGSDDICDIHAIVVTVGAGICCKPSHSELLAKEVTYFRKIHIVDQSSVMLCLCTWQELGEVFKNHEGEAVSINNLQWDYHDGPSLVTAGKCTHIHFNDDDPDHQALQLWYEENLETQWTLLLGHTTAAGAQLTNTAPPRDKLCIKEVLSCVGKKLDIDTFALVATCKILLLKDIGYYACMDKHCHKAAKCVAGTLHLWNCPHCNTRFTKPHSIYCLQLHLDNGTRECVVTTFDFIRCQLFGDWAVMLWNQQHSADPDEHTVFQAVLDQVAGKYSFTIQANTVCYTNLDGTHKKRTGW
ncbi:hypothetical protein DACRYDRAFT_98791 [Dacryopinax primogenitus]|uniref:Replication factor A C-terminal domain-containing protein n=1 Tax=Dacryopinax primogenitus (strain DJM 731) TaxID=1858805 RepID=M5G4C3_DACPD|nr:uncharacterized protein DACRYDRAFT_98791 [Dacryopinax primogenitus]EJU05111.1 hypothetical protein DACRYDRAFT_98791 [Dacryopinax primogenitus]